MSEITHFKCANCSKNISISAPGTHNRNHCPYCLYSLHVDVVIGDRKSTCGGLMKPVGKYYKPDGEEVLVHQCVTCGFTRYNRVAGDDDISEVEQLTVVAKPA